MDTPLAHPPSRRKTGGRPRRFEDEDVFHHVANMMLEGGLASVSLPRLAAAIGCTHQALGSRFSSRSGLLQAFFDWTSRLVYEDVAAIARETESPLERIRTWMLLPVDPRFLGNADSPPPTLWMTVTFQLLSDPDMAKLVTEAQLPLREMLAGMVRAAQQQGELGPGDPYRIAYAVLSAASGASFNWLLRPEGDLREMMSWCLDSMIRAFK